jgi:hypothetical protein
MNSLFDLKQSASELPSLNQGLAKQTYEQHPPTRDVTGVNFPKGSQHIRWQVAGTRWWIPSKSYIRMRCVITGPAGALPDVNSDIAPNMGLMANLYQSAEFKIADKTVSRVSDYMAQVDALDKRLTKSGAWLQSIGQDLEQFHEDQQFRMNTIASDGYTCEEDYINPVDPVAESGLELGFDVATNQASYTSATETMLFIVNAGGAIDIQNIQVLNVGDKIVGTGGAWTGFEGTIIAIVDGLNALVRRTNGVAADIAATVINGNITFIRFPFPAVDGSLCNISQQRNQLELVWQPPLSMFKIGHAMPAGKYELTLTPQNSVNYKKRAIESLLGDKTVLTDFDFTVTDMYLYLATVEGPAVDTMSYFISLEETRCQAESVKDGIQLQQQNFDVSPSSYALTCAFQDVTAGTNTDRSASKFKVRAVVGVPSGELALSRFFIQYAGQNKPQPDSDPDFVSPAALNTQLYAESQLYSGAYYDAGSGEDKSQWTRRGPYYYYAWPRDGNSESTRVNVNFQFNPALGPDVGRVLLFDHHKQMILVSIVDGRVVDVVSQDG